MQRSSRLLLRGNALLPWDKFPLCWIDGGVVSRGLVAIWQTVVVPDLKTS
jgi:hypothetical protein